ncbi:E3 ubiquitin-protein ligase TRIM71-like [Mytilus edulis]|uniref:B box-type domain-containing protein n=1 Tax=Mytilus edulis TaxID=6550 RepID=A0A8S3SLQ9_MYTED|nr:unnamed protein product [Mytilus edulis]
MAQSVIKTCEICNQDAGKDYCQNCEQTFCNKCKTMHLRMKPSSNHVFRSGQQCQDSTLSVCDEHSSDYIYLCESCYVPACMNCAVSTHKGHTMANLSTSIAEKREKLRKILKTNFDCISNVKNSTTTLQNMIEDLRKKCNAIHGDMIPRQRQLQSRLTKISMHGDILKFEESEKRKVETYIKNVNECDRNINELVELYKYVKDEKDVTNLIQSLKTLEKDTMNIRIPKVPLISNIEFVTEPMNEDFDAKLESLLGKVTIAPQ